MTERCGYRGISNNKPACTLPVGHVADGLRCSWGGDAPKDTPMLKDKADYKQKVKGCTLCRGVARDPRYGVGHFDPYTRTHTLILGDHTEAEPERRLYGAAGYLYKESPFDTHGLLDHLSSYGTTFAANSMMCPTKYGGRPDRFKGAACVRNHLLNLTDYIRPKVIFCLGDAPFRLLYDVIGVRRTYMGGLVDHDGIMFAHTGGGGIAIQLPSLNEFSYRRSKLDVQHAKLSIDRLMGKLL